MATFALEEQVVTDADFDTLEQAAEELGGSVEEIQASIDAVISWQLFWGDP